MRRFLLLPTALLLAAAIPASAQECEAMVEPIKAGWNFAELAYYDFGEHVELMIGTPTQPTDFTYRLELDFQDRTDILLLPGLDDFVLSLTPPDGNLALPESFIHDVLTHANLRVFAMLDENVEEEVEYDLTALAAAIENCTS